MKHRNIVGAAILGTAVATGSWAAMLGVVPGLPLMSYDNNGITVYDATTDILDINATPTTVFTGTGISFVFPASFSGVKDLQILAEVDANGALVGGVPGDDLVIEGMVTIGPDTYDGILLTGEVLEFGFNEPDPGATTVLYDFRFQVTGGELAPIYAGSDAGLTVTSEYPAPPNNFPPGFPPQRNSVDGFTVDFGGEAKGNIGPIEMLCNLVVEKEACVVIPPPSPANACDGKVTDLTFTYTGEDCDATWHDQDPSKVECDGDPMDASPVRIRIFKDSGNVYADVPMVPLGGEVIASAANAGDNELASNSFFEIYDMDDNLIQSGFFHTSCSQPLGCGYQFGALFVQAMNTTNGSGCEWEEPTEECVTDYRPSDTVGCDDDLLRLELRYLGGDCDQSMNDQPADKVDCQGDAGIVEPVRVLVTNKDGNRVYADVSGLPLGGVVLASAANAGQGKFDSETHVRIFDDMDNEIQFLKFHTSCSQPLGLGDQFGSLQVVGIDSSGGGSGQLGTDVDYTVTITNLSPFPLMNIVVDDDVIGPVPGSPIAFLGPTQSVELTYTDFLLDTTTNTVTAVGDAGNGVFCDGSDSATITFIPPPVPGLDCCEYGSKLSQLLMTYTGEDCDATFHSQDPKNVKCMGDPASADPVFIRATEKENPNDTGGKIWFEGLVGLGGQYVIDAANADQTALKSDTYIHIFDQTGTYLLQTVKFHTSCSKPLHEGDQFGANLVNSCTLEDGPLEGRFCVGGAKPAQLVMEYTQDDCNATSNFQDSGKVFCEDTGVLLPMVWIRVGEKDNPWDFGGKVFFDGYVMANTTFVIDAANAGETKLKSDTRVHIYDGDPQGPGGANHLQYIRFHTSCSQPLNQDDQFGSLRLDDFIAE